MVRAAHLGEDLGTDRIIVLGDVWDVDLSMKIGEHTPQMDIIPGNHERWGVWAKGKFGEGITAHNDYTTFKLAGRKFGVIGRIADTPTVRSLMGAGLYLGEPDKIFFHELDGQKIRDALGGSDVLLFHDAPWPFVLGYRPLPPLESYRARAAPPIDHPEIVGSEYLSEVVRTIEPKYAFSGHMHLLDIRYIGKTRAYGLPPIDPIFQHRGYVILDTDDLSAHYSDLPAVE